MKKSKNKICIVLGTRPEIIKMAPIISECSNLEIPFFIIHTGQHYSYNMDEIFIKELGLPIPKYNLQVGSGLHGQQTGKMLSLIEDILIKEKPSFLLVQGDTNSVLAGGLAAKKLNIAVGHVEAGLRSYDNTMPEEINRKIVDHISDLLFAPTIECAETLFREGINKNVIFNTGNTIVDAVKKNINYANSIILSKLGVERNKFILLTAHRAENVDSQAKMKNILEGLRLIHEASDMNIIWPIHPRTLSSLRKFRLTSSVNALKRVQIIDPVGYFDSLLLQSEARMLLTDSGGLQEESCILGTPCITLRENTERPESISCGANRLTGTNPQEILKAYQAIMKRDTKWKNPFGSGKAGKKIVSLILKRN